MLHYQTYYLGPEKDWVVFVHGAGGSSSIWFKQIKAYKKHFNVLLVDLRGHGKSKDLMQKYYEDQYTFQLISKDILNVLDEVGIEKAHFVGVSLGTIIIRTIGEIDPDRVESMVMSGAVMRLNIRSRFLVWVGHLFKKVVPFMWLYKLFAWIILPRKRHSESRLLFIREAKKLYQKEFLKWFNMTKDINPLLRYFREKELPIPTLYVMGSEDYLFLPPVRKIVSDHKQSVLQVIEECGHVCNVEQPNVFNRLSIQFLKNQ
ncbi:alpha/beta hydrolase [Balneolaceae bacterium YR4-1]|uniref:Alpha/beta hydrolase n=1 Tax=Halalkalibaculum roseum TaxID=2709311 RepID=A0A6M1T806_9BACT|nr:alpha/beta hydrolase [Halalkalibaculum roseum]NGP76413.1 alpha/beta hydrolase [Halalkalibaculum roseum]